MKLPSLNFKISSVTELVSKNLSIILLGVLGIIFLLVGWVVFAEIKKVSLVTEDNSGITGQLVRVHTGQHQELVKKLEESAKFSPKMIPGNEIFSTAPNLSR